MDVKFDRSTHDAIYNSVARYKKLPVAYTEPEHSMLIQGDNMRALKTLAEDKNILGKVKLVYIDPPFATNTTFRLGSSTGRTATISSSSQDEIAYTDTLSGEDYLDFIRQRLVLLKKIMHKDASIYLHIDYKIGHYVKILMDEVFGIESFRNDITRIKCNPKNFSRRAYGNIKDLILYYAQGEYTWNDPRNAFSDEDIARLFPKIDKNGRRYTTNPIHAPGETKKGSSGSEWKGMMPPKGRHWRYSPDELTKLDAQGKIHWSKNGVPRKIIYADERRLDGKKVQDIWDFKDPQYPEYPTEKNIELLKQIITASSNVGDIVLDCFAGSGTTLVAAKELGREWIGIDESKGAVRVATKKLKSTKNAVRLL